MPKRTRGLTKGKAPEQPVSVKIDPALKKAWSAALAALEAASRSGAQAFDRKYEAVGAILEHEPPLYLAGGLSTVGDFVSRHLPGEEVRSVLRNARVAKYASPVEEETYGTSKIDVVIDYLEVKNGKPAHGRIPVDFAKLRIATKDGSIPFADATVQQIRDATRALGKSAKKPKTSPVVRAIVACVPREAKEITVHYGDGHVSVGKIPVRIYGAVMRALAKAAVPTT